MNNVILPTMQCTRCKYTWIPRKEDIKFCPNCKSSYWNKERVRGINMLDTIRLKLGKAIFPKTVYENKDAKEFRKLIATVKGSLGADAHFKKYLELLGVPIIKDTRVEIDNWHAHVVETAHKSFIIVMKSRWLYNFGKIFDYPEAKGTGLNVDLIHLCDEKDIHDCIIVTPKGMMYHLDIDELKEFVKEHNTIREEMGMYEAHVPLSMLKGLIETEQVKPEKVL